MLKAISRRNKITFPRNGTGGRGLFQHICAYAGGLLCLVAVCSAQHKAPGEIHVETTPLGAIISHNGATKGTSPLTLSNLAPGKHLITASKAEHHDARQTVTLEGGQVIPLRMRLEPILGLAIIHSTPPGAEVVIDNADRGKTPLLITDLPPGKHRVQLTLAGFLPKEIELTITDRTPVKIETEMTSDSAMLIVRSTPEGATVVLNGTLKGNTPCRIDRVPGGNSTLELSLDGYEPYKETIRLVAGRSEKIETILKPLPSDLTIETIPTKARIYVKDQFRGDSPVKLTELPPGEYRIRAELTGHDTMARTITLLRAEQRVEEFRLQRNCGKLSITTSPAGVTILVNGKESGTTRAVETETDRISEPLEIDLLPVGTHEVELSLKGYFPQKFKINVERDQTLTAHRVLQRRFIPNYEVKTSLDIFRGVLVQIDPKGDVRLEIRPGIIKTIPANEIRSKGPLRETSTEE